MFRVILLFMVSFCLVTLHPTPSYAADLDRSAIDSVWLQIANVKQSSSQHQSILSGSCEDVFDCAPGQRCVNGRCSGGVGGGCEGSYDCAPGQRCVNGRCSGGAGGGCEGSYDCAPGQRCVNGRCSGGAGGGCEDIFDCAPGQRCVNGRCSGA